jgi:hypothetical protein
MSRTYFAEANPAQVFAVRANIVFLSSSTSQIAFEYSIPSFLQYILAAED